MHYGKKWLIRLLGLLVMTGVFILFFWWMAQWYPTSFPFEYSHQIG